MTDVITVRLGTKGRALACCLLAKWRVSVCWNHSPETADLL